jgi:hypothetical protein
MCIEIASLFKSSSSEGAPRPDPLQSMFGLKGNEKKPSVPAGMMNLPLLRNSLEQSKKRQGTNPAA